MEGLRAKRGNLPISSILQLLTPVSCFSILPILAPMQHILRVL
jgi:hypothetical protein